MGIFGFFACSSPSEPKPLVYEGMSAKELEDVLGMPMDKDTGRYVYEGETMEKLPVEKWVYSKRIVLLINDTVKNPNLNSSEAD